MASWAIMREVRVSSQRAPQRMVQIDRIDLEPDSSPALLGRDQGCS